GPQAADLRVARPYQAGDGDYVRDRYEHRRVPAVPDAEGRYGPVHLQPASRHDLRAGRLAPRVDDVHPAHQLLPAAGGPGAADPRAAAARVPGALLQGRALVHRAPVEGARRLVDLPDPGRRRLLPHEARVLPEGPDVPLVCRYLPAGRCAA